MVFPVGVQHLQRHRLFDVIHDFTAVQVDLLFIGLIGSFSDTLTQCVFVQMVVFLEPLLDGQFQAEFALQLIFQTVKVPLLFEALRWN